MSNLYYGGLLAQINPLKMSRLNTIGAAALSALAACGPKQAPQGPIGDAEPLSAAHLAQMCEPTGEATNYELFAKEGGVEQFHTMLTAATSAPTDVTAEQMVAAALYNSVEGKLGAAPTPAALKTASADLMEATSAQDTPTYEGRTTLVRIQNVGGAYGTLTSPLRGEKGALSSQELSERYDLGSVTDAVAVQHALSTTGAFAEATGWDCGDAALYQIAKGEWPVNAEEAQGAVTRPESNRVALEVAGFQSFTPLDAPENTDQNGDERGEFVKEFASTMDLLTEIDQDTNGLLESFDAYYGLAEYTPSDLVTVEMVWPADRVEEIEVAPATEE